MGAPRILMALAALGSAALLAAALGFQFLGGLTPCVLCIYQRWPHLLAMLAGLIGWMRPGPLPALLGMSGALGSAAVGAFHTGVERGWWEGLAACSAGPDLTQMTPEQALEAMMNAAPMGCDVVAWSFLGLSMASWNMVISLGLAALWAVSAKRSVGRK